VPSCDTTPPNRPNRVYPATAATPATLHAPTVSATVVAIPPSANNKTAKTGTPTGQVANGYGVGNFEITPGAASSFIFATIDGTISARGGATAVIEVDNGAKGAVYTGLALGVSSAGPTPYAANFSKGTIDTFDPAWKANTMPGGLQHPDLPACVFPS